MKTYTYFKTKIDGYEDVAETVKTIEKIAASGVHLIKSNVSALNSYLETSRTVLNRLALVHDSQAAHPLLEKKSGGRSVVLLLTADKGLVGGLWHRLFETYRDQLADKSLIVVGTQGQALTALSQQEILRFFSFGEATPGAAEVDTLYDYLVENFLNGAFKDVSILYPSFVSIGEQTPLCVPFLPFSVASVYNESAATTSDAAGWPICEIPSQKLFAGMLEAYVKGMLYGLVLETKLAELSARTVAMEHAAKKTEERVQKLHLEHAKERRYASTQKQLESYAARQTI